MIVQREKGDVVVQTDSEYVSRISLPAVCAIMRDGRVTIELHADNTLADLAYACIETLDELDGIEADKLTSVPDA